MSAKPQARPQLSAGPRLASAKPSARKGKLKCQALTSAGAPCPSWPKHGSTLCVFHTPGVAATLGAKGGRRRATYLGEPLEVPQCAADVQKMMATMMAQVTRGDVDPRIAACVGSLAGQYLKALELYELEERMAAMKAKLGL